MLCSSSPSGQSRTVSPRIYVTNHLDNTAWVIDGGTNKVVATVTVGVAPAPDGEMYPDQKSVYVANTGSDTVSVLNTDDNTIARTIALPGGSTPVDVAVDPKGRYLYTANGGSNRVSVLDTRATVSWHPCGLAPSP